MRLALVLAALAAVFGTAAAAAGKDKLPTTAVSIPAQATQKDALAALHRQTGMLVLSECTQVEHRTKSGWSGVSFAELIPQLTETYHLHALAGQDRALFVRRFWDPRERPEIPIEELAAIVGDLHAIVDPLTPHFARLESAQWRRGFFHSLTPDQLAAAARGELTFASLPQEQQRRWNVLCAETAFGSLEQDLRRYASLFQHWERCSGYWQSRQYLGEERQSLLIRYPVPGIVGKNAEFELWRINPDPPELPDVPSRASVEELGPAPKRAAGCRRPFDEPLTQPVELGSLVSGIAEANGITIRIPEYAQGRRFYVYADGRPGDDVLLALGAAEGWELRQLGKGKYALDRPRVGRSRDYWDYYRQLRAAVPPMVRMLVEDSPDVVDARRLRQRRERLLLMEQMVRGGAQVPDFSLTDLRPEWQRRLADFIFELYATQNVGRPLTATEPVGWLTHPERGYFRLTYSLEGKPIDMEFRVPKPSEPGRISYDMWGWGIGGSSLGF